jgi:hypothetical protein
MSNNSTRRNEKSSPFIPTGGILKQGKESDSLDTIFATLKNQCRRYIVYYLYQRGDLAVDELVELIAASEKDGDQSTVTADEREVVQIGLIHTHLPKLVEAGIIEYDDVTQQVRLKEDIPHLRPHLDEAARTDLQ